MKKCSVKLLFGVIAFVLASCCFLVVQADALSQSGEIHRKTRRNVRQIEVENGMHLFCEDNKLSTILQINIAIAPDDVITLQNSSCPIGRNATHVTAQTSFLDCGTTFKETEEEFIFTNVLTVIPKTPENAVILRRHQVPREYELRCSFIKSPRTTLDTGMIHIFENVCASQANPCNKTTSFCAETPNSFQCKCRDGYINQPGGTECLDYCEAGQNYCEVATTVCVPTPGIGPNYRCDCLNSENVKQAYYRCAGPQASSDNPKSDGEMQVWIFVVVGLILLVIIGITVLVYFKHMYRSNYDVADV